MKFDLTKVGTAVKNKAGMLGLKIQTKSPELLLATGLVCMAGAVVASAVAGKKQEKIAEDHLGRLKKAKETTAEVTTTNEAGEEVTVTVERSEKEVKAAVSKVYMETAKLEAKCWWLTVALFGLGSGCVIGARNTMAKRIKAVTLASAGVEEAFRRYQENNIALNGQESHEMCKNGFTTEETVNETGEKVVKKVMKTAEEAAAENISSIFYDHRYEFNIDTAPTTYRKNTSSMFNYNFLDAVERSVQQIVDSRGYCSADEAARMCGIERDENQIIIDLQDGWFRGGPKVSLGHRESVNNPSLAGYGNRSIILDFNVHGNLAYLLDQQARATRMVYEELKNKKAEEIAE